MKKTITCATTSLLLIGILTLQTLAINFKSEENIDNLVFPFIYSDADDLVWVRKYVGDCSTCIEGRLYVKDMVTGEVKEIVSDAVKQLRESEDTLYCITNRGSHRPNISSVISGYKQPSKSAQSIEITGFIEKSKPPEIIFLYTLLPLTA